MVSSTSKVIQVVKTGNSRQRFFPARTRTRATLAANSAAHSALSRVDRFMPPCGYYPRSQYPRAVSTTLTTSLMRIDPAGGRGFVPETPAKADADIEIREARITARARFFIEFSWGTEVRS